MQIHQLTHFNFTINVLDLKHMLLFCMSCGFNERVGLLKYSATDAVKKLQRYSCKNPRISPSKF